MSGDDQKFEWICRYHDSSDCKWIQKDGKWIHRSKISNTLKLDLNTFAGESYISNQYLFEEYSAPAVSNFYDSSLADTEKYVLDIIKTITNVRVRNLKFKDGKMVTLLKYGVLVLVDGSIMFVNKHHFVERQIKPVSITIDKIYLKTAKDYITAIFKSTDKSVPCKKGCKYSKIIAPQWVHKNFCNLIDEDESDQQMLSDTL